MPDIKLEDVTMIFPFAKVTGLFDRKQKQKILDEQKNMPYTSNEGVIALQHFSTVINDGEFVVILGPSGSGKSTLLRIIAGLERPTLGKICFDGEEYNGVRAEDRDVAMVFQNYSLYPNQTVYENIAFPLQVKHTPREEIDAEVKKICELLKLSDKLEKLPQDLSGGEKQRVAIARSLIKKPSVLLFDEPFSNLDVIMRARLRNELKALHEAYHTTFIYVTHDQYDALSLAERIIILKDGIKQMDDPVSDIYNYPVNRFCAQFVGFPPMNVYDDVCLKDGSFNLFGHEFKADRKQYKKLNKTRNISIGIRGSNVHIDDHGVEAIVEYVEPIEADLIIHAAIDDKKIVIVERMKKNYENKYLRGQKVFLNFDEDRFHLFDEDGERL